MCVRALRVRERRPLLTCILQSSTLHVLSDSKGESVVTALHKQTLCVLVTPGIFQTNVV